MAEEESAIDLTTSTRGGSQKKVGFCSAWKYKIVSSGESLTNAVPNNTAKENRVETQQH